MYDFHSHSYPGESFHSILKELRNNGDLSEVTFNGHPATLITSHRALKAAFEDNHLLVVDKDAVISFEMNPANPPDFIHAIQPEVQWRRVAIVAAVSAALSQPASPTSFTTTASRTAFCRSR